MKPLSGYGHGQGIARIQAEEPHARLSFKSDIGADIELGESREPGKRRRAAQPNPSHAKWNNRKPSLSLERVDLQALGYVGSELRGFDWPVRKEQVVPALPHHPRPGRQRPGPVRHSLQDCLRGHCSGFLDRMACQIYPCSSPMNRILKI
jgi:hypothetical protein